MTDDFEEHHIGNNNKRLHPCPLTNNENNSFALKRDEIVFDEPIENITWTKGKKSPSWEDVTDNQFDAFYKQVLQLKISDGWATHLDRTSEYYAYEINENVSQANFGFYHSNDK